MLGSWVVLASGCPRVSERETKASAVSAVSLSSYFFYKRYAADTCLGFTLLLVHEGSHIDSKLIVNAQNWAPVCCDESRWVAYACCASHQCNRLHRQPSVCCCECAAVPQLCHFNPGGLSSLLEAPQTLMVKAKCVAVIAVWWGNLLVLQWKTREKTPQSTSWEGSE